MTTLFDKLNLKPAERRLVVFVALIVFIVLNAFFVWPKFFEWSRVQQREKTALQNLDQFRREVDRIPAYERQLRELEKAGAAVASEDQASKLQTTVYSQAALSGVQVNTYTAPPASRFGSGGKTNMFFDEQIGTIQFIAEEHSLVDFLYNLGAGGSMIRVRQMTLNPDPPRQKLQGSITLVASFARRAAPRASAATTSTAAPGRPGQPAPAPAAAPARAAVSNAPAAKPSWFSRFWPFGKKTAAPTTNSSVTTNTARRSSPFPSRTNAVPVPKR